MKKMGQFLTLNWGWLLLIAVGLVAAVYAATKLRKPEPVVQTTESKNFATDSIVSTPVMAHNPYADLFADAARAAIGPEKVNPWVYLEEHWLDRRVSYPAGTRGTSIALINFITKNAGRKIPDSSQVSLSIRDYSNENSVVMEYRDPAKDTILVATGHDPEPALYATFANKNESKTFKLICTNGLVRDLGGEITHFNEEYLIKEGDDFVTLTESTPIEAYGFALHNQLPVRVVLKSGRIHSKTPEISRKKVFANYKKLAKLGAKFDVVLQPGDVLRREDGSWLYVKTE